MTPLVFSPAHMAAIAPFAFLVVAAIAILLQEAFDPAHEAPERTLWLSLLALVATAGLGIACVSEGNLAFGGTWAWDRVALYGSMVCLLAGGLSLALVVDHMPVIGVRAREVYPLVLFAVAGMMVMCAARDLLVLFLGLEIMSVPAYVLAGLHRSDDASAEASLKYCVLGALASAFLLYGIALIWGATGATSYAGVAAGLGAAPRLMALAGLGLLLVGFGFKIGLVPFHFWAPDVYQGAPTSITALMTVGVKAAAVLGLARLLLEGLAPLAIGWGMVLWWTSVLTMTLANVVALAQTNVKRMLAYSSLAHAGYLVAALAAGTPRAGGAALFYLLTYALMTIGAFGVLVAVAGEGEPRDGAADFAGLAERRPMLAGAMTIFLFSLMGIPPLAGFAGKLYLIETIVVAGDVGLATILILNSVVAGFYYLRVILDMFTRDPVGEAPVIEARPYVAGCLFVAMVATIFLGVFPDIALDAAREAFAALRQVAPA